MCPNVQNLVRNANNAFSSARTIGGHHCQESACSSQHVPGGLRHPPTPSIIPEHAISMFLLACSGGSETPPPIPPPSHRGTGHIDGVRLLAAVLPYAYPPRDVGGGYFGLWKYETPFGCLHCEYYFVFIMLGSVLRDSVTPKMSSQPHLTSVAGGGTICPILLQT